MPLKSFKITTLLIRKAFFKCYVQYTVQLNPKNVATLTLFQSKDLLLHVHM